VVLALNVLLTRSRLLETVDVLTARLINFLRLEQPAALLVQMDVLLAPTDSPARLVMLDSD